MGFWGSSEQVARSAACFLLLPPSLIGCCTGAIVAALRGAPTAEVQAWYARIARICLSLAGTDLRVHGLEHVDPNQAYVVVSNHESNWDPISILGAMPKLPIRFLVKRQLLQIPVLGQTLRLTGNVEVDRRHRGSNVKRLQKHMSQRSEDVSMLFFAEGTRARDGAFREFKMGAFATALTTGLPILPVATAGTRRVWAVGSAAIKSGPVVVEIGEPIRAEGLSLDARGALRSQTHEVVGKLRARARQRLRDAGVEPGGVD